MRTFEEMVRGSYDFNQRAYDEDIRWRVLDKMFFLNQVFGKTNECHIPKIIHQIWLGSKMPDREKEWAKTWQDLHPDWDYYLWGDSDDLKNILNEEQLTICNSIQNAGQRSDYMRYHIINAYGGIYVDTDFECIKPFDDLMYLDFFTGVGYPRTPELYIGLIASVPNHPILQNIINSMTEVRQGGWKNIFETTGSYFFTRKFFETVGDYMDGVVAFPYPFFYPFPNQAGHETRKGKDYITEESYAVHHWRVSWGKK